MRLTFLGPPGSGKGTQAERFSRELQIPHIATGDILREKIKRSTAVGRQVRSYLESGKLVPDEVILSLVLEEVEGKSGFLLDGFPRTLVQAEALEKKAPIDLAVFFDISESVLVDRLSHRLICEDCGSVHNLTFDPPKVDGRCDRCNGNLITRKDDEPATVRRRLHVYKRETLPLIEYYSGRNLLEYVDAEGSPDGVYRRIKELICKSDNPKV